MAPTAPGDGEELNKINKCSLLTKTPWGILNLPNDCQYATIIVVSASQPVSLQLPLSVWPDSLRMDCHVCSIIMGSNYLVGQVLCKYCLQYWPHPICCWLPSSVVSFLSRQLSRKNVVRPILLECGQRKRCGKIEKIVSFRWRRKIHSTRHECDATCSNIVIGIFNRSVIATDINRFYCQAGLIQHCHTSLSFSTLSWKWTEFVSTRN